MNLFRAYDAEYPPAQAPAGCYAVLGYIGGSADHTWTVEEWRQASDNGRLRQGPIWGAQLDLDPVANGQLAVAMAALRGWKEGRAIWLDMETWQAPAWVASFIAAVEGAGYAVGVYGSQSTVFANPAGRGGYWVADWDGTPDVMPVATGHQYLAGVPDDGTEPDQVTEINLDVFDVSVLDLFGRGPRI